jgi:hypothetical protein
MPCSLVGNLSYRSRTRLARNGYAEFDCQQGGVLVSATVTYSNKELVSVAIWINDAKENLVVGPVRQLLPRRTETPRLLSRL